MVIDTSESAGQTLDIADHWTTLWKEARLFFFFFSVSKAAKKEGIGTLQAEKLRKKPVYSLF